MDDAMQVEESDGDVVMREAETFPQQFDTFDTISNLKHCPSPTQLIPNGVMQNHEEEKSAIVPQHHDDSTSNNTESSRPGSSTPESIRPAPVAPSNMNSHSAPPASGDPLSGIELEPPVIVPYVDVSFEKVAVPPNMEMCLLCGSTGDEKEMIFCHDCGEAFHTFCLSPPVTKEYLFPSPEEWRCPQCKFCDRCCDTHNEDELIVCDKCDRCFHIYCLDPPLKAVPSDGWRCSDCVMCLRCGAKQAGPEPDAEWKHSSTLCTKCALIYDKKLAGVVNQLNVRLHNLQNAKPPLRRPVPKPMPPPKIIQPQPQPQPQSQQQSQPQPQQQTSTTNHQVPLPRPARPPSPVHLSIPTRPGSPVPPPYDFPRLTPATAAIQFGLFEKLFSSPMNQLILEEGDIDVPPLERPIASPQPISSRSHLAHLTKDKPKFTAHTTYAEVTPKHTESTRGSKHRLEDGDYLPTHRKPKRQKLLPTVDATTLFSAPVPVANGFSIQPYPVIADKNEKPPKKRKLIQTEVLGNSIFQTTPSASPSFPSIYQKDDTKSINVAPFAASLTISEIQSMLQQIQHGSALLAVFDMDRIDMNTLNWDELIAKSEGKRRGIRDSPEYISPETFDLEEPPDLIEEKKRADPRQCGFCRAHGDLPFRGRLLSVDTDVWVHANCALWSAEVYETDSGTICNVKHALRRGDKTLCSFCNDKGATVNCSFQSCKNVYHIHCAIKAHCNIVLEDSKSGKVYCADHTRRQEADVQYDTPPRKPIPRHLFVKLHRLLWVSRPILHRTRALLPYEKLRLGTLTLESFGSIDTEHPAFHERQRIYPPGYTVQRRYWSWTQSPTSGGCRCNYKLYITADSTGDYPLFCVQSEDDPDYVITSNTLEGAWNTVIKKVNESRSARQGTPIHKNLKADFFFGLYYPIVIRTLECHPRARLLKKYRFQYDLKIRLPTKLVISTLSGYLPPDFKTEIAPSEGGCARASIWKRMSGEEKYKYLDAYSHHPVSLYLESRSLRDTSGTQVRSSKTAGFELPRELVAAAFRQMKQRQNRVLRVMRSKIQGWGVFAADLIKENEFIIEYIGELIRQKVADVREKRYEAQGIGCYMFRLDENTIIDATRSGNIARLINHCCEPNAATKEIVHEGKKRIIIYAKRDIQRGEEITYDYMFAYEENKIPCNCGAANCRGWMN